MTVERNIVFGFDDLKAVAFECKKCGARLFIQANALRDVPLGCASCNTQWRALGGQSITAESAAEGLLQVVVTLRSLIRRNESAFRVLLQFEEPGAEKA